MKHVLKRLREARDAVVDRISDFTGYAAVRVPLQKASRDGEVTLDLTGYRQVNTYACGAIASAMVVKFLRPQMSFERIHAAVDPTQATGAGTVRVVRALRSLGISVSRKANLTFDSICAAIDAGHPVMVWVKTEDAHTDHWVVIYGYGCKPKLVFVAGQGWPLIHKQRVDWADFRRQWASPGEGLVCSKSRKIVPRPARKK